MADYALVVGIECYETAYAKTLPGPSLDALRFALWLFHVQKVSAKNLILFQNKSNLTGKDAETYQDLAAKAEKAQIVIRPDPSLREIMEAWTKELLSGPAEAGTVWLYWSGHGVTLPEAREAVLCSDVEEGNPSYIFLSEFRDSLRSRTFQRFTKQRLIVDACADFYTPADLNFTNFRNPRTWPVTEAPEQIELDAVAIGSPATAEAGGSLFSRVLLKQLES